MVEKKPKEVLARTKLVSPVQILRDLPSPQFNELNKLDAMALRVESKYFSAEQGSVFTFKPNEDELAIANYLMYSLRIGRVDLVRRALVELYHRVRAEQKKNEVKA